MHDNPSSSPMRSSAESDSSITQVHSPAESKQLQANALGLLSTAALTAAYMGPALSIYTLFGPMSNQVGSGVGFVMIIATGLTLLSAISFGMLAKEIPSAGGVYAWSRFVLGESVGLWIGISTAIYYTICLFFPPIVFGQFFNDVLNQTGLIEKLGMSSGIGSWCVGAIILLTFGAYIAYRGIAVSAHFAFTLLIIEIAVISAVALTFLLNAISNGTFSLTPMTLDACNDGSGRSSWHLAFLALPLGLLSVACDAATPTAEETKNAKWTIPVAVVLTCFIIGIGEVLGFSIFALARTAADAKVSDLENVVPQMVNRVWGKWGVLVSLTAMTAALGAFIPGILASSRVIFAMAREGKLPRCLATTHNKYLVPWNALHVAFVVTILSVFPAVIAYGVNPTIDWWGSVFGWFIGVVYIAANLVNMVYYWKYARDRFHPILNFLIPVVALLVQFVVIGQSVGVALWKGGYQGRSAQAFIVLICAISTIYVLFVRNRSKKLHV